MLLEQVVDAVAGGGVEWHGTAPGKCLWYADREDAARVQRCNVQTFDPGGARPTTHCSTMAILASFFDVSVDLPSVGAEST
jgi:hypothetical protein